MDNHFTRRQVLGGSARVGLALAVGLPMLQACGDSGGSGSKLRALLGGKAQEIGELFPVFALAAAHDRRQQKQARALGHLQQPVDHLRRSLRRAEVEGPGFLRGASREKREVHDRVFRAERPR